MAEEVTEGHDPGEASQPGMQQIRRGKAKVARAHSGQGTGQRPVPPLLLLGALQV